MMIRQEGKRPPIGVINDAALRMIQQLRAENLLGNGLSLIHENPAGSSRSAGAKRYFISVFAGRLGFAVRRRKQRLRVNLLYARHFTATLRGNDRFGVRLLQQIGRHIVIQRNIQQQRVIACPNHAPESWKPFLAGIHSNRDKRTRCSADLLLKVRRIVHCHRAVVPISQSVFFLFLQPDGRFRVSMLAR